jgi:glycosyltransferase involved in cell wall biosynthesis
MNIGIIARSDNTGLGNQTRELTYMLNPSKVMLINSQPFNKNKQHPEWYQGYEVYPIRGFPRTEDINYFLKGLDVVITCETFYNNNFVEIARKKNVKTVLQYNYEFLDMVVNPKIPIPDILIGPTLWYFDHMQELFGNKAKVIHMPPPIDHLKFEEVRKINMSKDHFRILHVGGKAASEDRNGTHSVIDMLKHSKTDYELVIKTQTSLNINFKDSRIKIDHNDDPVRENLYRGFDLMILPRRYAGLCLPMNEALMSGLPVFMTNISPNNTILPKEWLANSEKSGTLKTRMLLDVYSADPKHLGKMVDSFINQRHKLQYKNHAFEIGMNNFSTNNLKDRYFDILK